MQLLLQRYNLSNYMDCVGSCCEIWFRVLIFICQNFHPQMFLKVCRFYLSLENHKIRNISEKIYISFLKINLYHIYQVRSKKCAMTKKRLKLNNFYTDLQSFAKYIWRNLLGFTKTLDLK